MAKIRPERQLARALLSDEQTPFRREFEKGQAMINRLIKQSSTLDKAIAASLTAMLAMNVFIMSQQLADSPAVAQADRVAAARQA